MKTLVINYSSTTGENKEIKREIEESKFNAFKKLYTDKIIEMYYEVLEVKDDFRFTTTEGTLEYRIELEKELKARELANSINFKLL